VSHGYVRDIKVHQAKAGVGAHEEGVFRGRKVRCCEEQLEETRYGRVWRDLEEDGRATVDGICRKGRGV